MLGALVALVLALPSVNITAPTLTQINSFALGTAPARAVSDQAPCEDRPPVMIAPNQEPGETGLHGATPEPLKRRIAYHLTTYQLAHQTRALKNGSRTGQVCCWLFIVDRETLEGRELFCHLLSLPHAESLNSISAPRARAQGRMTYEV